MKSLKIREVEEWEDLLNIPFDNLSKMYKDYNLYIKVQIGIAILLDDDIKKLINGEGIKVDGWDDIDEAKTLIGDLITRAVLNGSEDPKKVRKYITDLSMDDFLEKYPKYKRMMNTLHYILVKRDRPELSYNQWKDLTPAEADELGTEALIKFEK